MHKQVDFLMGRGLGGLGGPVTSRCLPGLAEGTGELLQFQSAVPALLSNFLISETHQQNDVQENKMIQQRLVTLIN